MSKRLDGKIALITGAGTGVGRACMLIFAREGATVIGVSRTQKNLDETAALVKKAGGTGMSVAADLSKVEGAETAIKKNPRCLWPDRRARERGRRRL